MTNLEIIEQRCIDLNNTVLNNPKEWYTIVQSWMGYAMEIGPLDILSEEEYSDDAYHELIDRHFNKLYDDFKKLEIKMGLRPEMTFEEFMGDRYQGEPLQTQDQLLYKIKTLSASIKKLETNQLRMPDEVREMYLERENYRLTQALLDVKLENYAKTPEETAYVKLYGEYQMEYSNLFKDWTDI